MFIKKNCLRFNKKFVIERKQCTGMFTYLCKMAYISTFSKKALILAVGHKRSFRNAEVQDFLMRIMAVNGLILHINIKNKVDNWTH